MSSKTFCDFGVLKVSGKKCGLISRVFIAMENDAPILKKAEETVANHSPIPVPIHWQETGKADLDRDVRLSAIEPVLIGANAWWCALRRMAAPDRPLISNQSTHTLLGRPTIHSPPATKCAPFQPTRRRQYQMRGMVTTVYHFVRRTAI